MWGLYAQRARRNKCENNYEFGNDPMEIMQFENKAKMKVDHKIRILKLCIVCFSKINCDFCHEFYMFGHAHIFSPSFVVCIHLRC
jgi:hypothetical protein